MRSQFLVAVVCDQLMMTRLHTQCWVWAETWPIYGHFHGNIAKIAVPKWTGLGVHTGSAQLGWEVSNLNMAFCRLQSGTLGQKGPNDPVFLNLFIRKYSHMPKLTVYKHAQINISKTRPFSCLPDFQLCVSSTENWQVSRSQTCCSTSHYFNTAGTGEEHNGGEFVHQSKWRLCLFSQSGNVICMTFPTLITGAHAQYYVHLLCINCGLGWISYIRILFYGSVRSKTFNKENFCHPSNRKR